MDKDQRIIDLEQALEKCQGLIFNIKHGTDYLPAFYYEWMDNILNEIDILEEK